MKRSDWALVVLIVGVVAIASYFVVSSVLPSPDKDKQSAPTAMTITSDIDEPTTAVFNDQAINPTVKTTIGDQGMQTPFTLGSD